MNEPTIAVSHTIFRDERHVNTFRLLMELRYTEGLCSKYILLKLRECQVGQVRWAFFLHKAYELYSI